MPWARKLHHVYRRCLARSLRGSSIDHGACAEEWEAVGGGARDASAAVTDEVSPAEASSSQHFGLFCGGAAGAMPRAVAGLASAQGEEGGVQIDKRSLDRLHIF